MSESTKCFIDIIRSVIIWHFNENNEKDEEIKKLIIDLKSVVNNYIRIMEANKIVNCSIKEKTKELKTIVNKYNREIEKLYFESFENDNGPWSC